MAPFSRSDDGVVSDVGQRALERRPARQQHHQRGGRGGRVDDRDGYAGHGPRQTHDPGQRQRLRDPPHAGARHRRAGLHRQAVLRLTLVSA